MTATRKKMSPLDAALACQQKGDLDGAEESFRAALDQDPDDPDALVLLGVLLQKTKRAEEALTLIERGIAAALKRGRQPAPAWRVALAYAKRDAGDLEGALAIFDVLVEQAPGVPEPLFLRAGILQRLERHEDAIADYEAVLKHAPNDAKALNNLGVSLKAEKQLGDALTAFHKAVEIRPDYVQAAGNAGELLSDIGQMEAAIAMLRRAHSLEPENRNVEITLIDALQKGEMAEEAERLAERAFERDPDSVRAMVHLGNIRMVMGRRDEAVELAHRAREAEPDAPGVLSLLAEADRDIDAESLLADIERVVAELQDEDPPLGLHFAAAGLYERLKRYPEAFGHYRAGNAVRQEQLERLGEAYKPDRVTQRIDQLIATFDAERCAGPGGSSSELPVFIVGMPRSGTTLTEQILASHPDAAGAGELKEIGQIVTWLTRQHGFPVTLRQEHLREAAGGYLRHVGNVGKGAARVTDKMPGNYMHLGLIARMFPRARIIHCRRDPMDNCLSCFAQNFAADGLGWSTDLRDMGHQYCQYRRILDHWRAVLPPGRMLEIDYEDTVADLDVQARRLVDFVGLKWDEFEALSACGCGPSGD
jgi:tetratricopeptide (TPR) repeat protein